MFAVRLGGPPGFRMPLRETFDFPIVYAMNGLRMLNRLSHFAIVQHPRLSADGRMFRLAGRVRRVIALLGQRTDGVQHYENLGMLLSELMIRRGMFVRERRLFCHHDAFRYVL